MRVITGDRPKYWDGAETLSALTEFPFYFILQKSFLRRNFFKKMAKSEIHPFDELGVTGRGFAALTAQVR